MKRSIFSVLVVMAVATVSLATPVYADSQATIRLILPFGGGGSGDALTRIVAEQLSAGLGQPVVVELRPGAGGRIGIRAVKDAEADGRTLLVVPIAPMVVYGHVYSSLGYDPVTDFRPVSQLATFEFGLAVGTHVPAKSLAELVDWLRANPAGGSYGTPGAGTLPHFFGEMFASAARIQLRHVQYRGSSSAIADVLGGHLPLILTSTNELVEQHKAGRIRVLATSNRERSHFLPDVPTFREAGFDIEGTGWFGLFAPARTSAEYIAKVNAVLVAALAKPEVRDRILAIGLKPTGTTPEALGAIQLADIERWGPAVKASGFRPEQ